MKGFTLIELFITIAIVMILATIIGGAFTGGWKGLFDGTICKAGYTFSVDMNGYQQQIFDENGHAISCKK